MTFSDEQVEQLRAPIEESRVKQRKGGRGSVSYLEAWDMIDRANEIFGYDGWSYEVLSTRVLTEQDGRTVYEATVRVTAGDASRTDVGVNTTSNDRPDAHETAIKGAVSDGMKRALRTFGAQFGNSLYDKDRPRTAQRQNPVRAPKTTKPPISANGGNGGNDSDIPPHVAFLNTARSKLGMDQAQVLHELGIESVEEIDDLRAAYKVLQGVVS